MSTVGHRPGNTLRSREAAHGDGAQARPGARAPLAEQLPRSALRRRHLGAARPAGVRRLRRPDARARRRGPAPARAADPDAQRQGGSRVASLAAGPSRRGHGHVHRAAERMADGDAGRGARDSLDRRDHRARAARRDQVGDRAGARPDGFRAAAAAESAVHARHQRLALRRGQPQPDVLAGPPARDAERGGDLPLPPTLPRCRLQDLVRRRRPRLGLRADGGRRHDACRRRSRPRRDGRAQHGQGGQHPRPATCSRPAPLAW